MSKISEPHNKACKGSEVSNLSRSEMKLARAAGFGFRQIAIKAGVSKQGVFYLIHGAGLRGSGPCEMVVPVVIKDGRCLQRRLCGCQASRGIWDKREKRVQLYCGPHAALLDSCGWKTKRLIKQKVAPSGLTGRRKQQVEVEDKAALPSNYIAPSPLVKLLNATSTTPTNDLRK